MPDVKFENLKLSSFLKLMNFIQTVLVWDKQGDICLYIKFSLMSEHKAIYIKERLHIHLFDSRAFQIFQIVVLSSVN